MKGAILGPIYRADIIDIMKYYVMSIKISYSFYNKLFIVFKHFTAQIC